MGDAKKYFVHLSTNTRDRRQVVVELGLGQRTFNTRP